MQIIDSQGIWRPASSSVCACVCVIDTAKRDGGLLITAYSFAGTVIYNL